MIFVNQISELEYYNSTEPFGCYADAVFQPHDILLQANGFNITSSANTTIVVCDTAGNFIEDVTSYFDTCFCSFSIGGVLYYFVNIRCNNYSPFMVSNRCFTLNVVVTDISPGTVVFKKWTQKYEIATAATPVFASGVSIDGSLLPNCVPGNNPATCVGAVQYTKFGCVFDCIDAYTGDYYAQGSVISGTPFTFNRECYMKAGFRDVPSEVKRTISINCRTQRTETTQKYVLNGKVAYPVWKMLEIQAMMLANHLYVDDFEFQSVGGTVFTQATKQPKNCIYFYQLSIPLQDCYKWQIFGCVPDCDTLAYYYLLPVSFQQIYDDQLRPVARNSGELGIFFRSLPGVSMAQEVGFTLPCPAYSVMKVQSSGVLPKFIYSDTPIATNKVYSKQLSSSAIDLSPLCNGITNNNQVPVPDVTGYITQDISVPVPDVTGVQVSPDEVITVQVNAGPGWTLDNNYTSLITAEGVATLNISASGTFQSPVTNSVIATIKDALPQQDIVIDSSTNGNIPASSQLTIKSNGSIVYTGYATSVSQNTMQLQLFQIKYPL